MFRLANLIAKLFLQNNLLYYMCKIIFNQKVEFQKIQEFFGKYLFFGFKEEVYIKGIITMNISNYSTIIMEKYLKNDYSILEVENKDFLLFFI